jgi:hypothetical protein
LETLQKKCSDCHLLRPASEFSKNKNTKDGLQYQCKECVRDYKKKYVQKNYDRLKKEWSAYRSENREKFLGSMRAWYQKNRETALEKKKIYRKENRKTLNVYSINWSKKNKEKVRASQRNHHKNYPEKARARLSKRRAARLFATPPWLTKDHLDQIQDLYIIGSAFRLFTGQEYHVDHIVPLVSKGVCGLHVPWNMTVLEGDENRKKGNRYWPDMWSAQYKAPDLRGFV